MTRTLSHPWEEDCSAAARLLVEMTGREGRPPSSHATFESIMESSFNPGEIESLDNAIVSPHTFFPFIFDLLSIPVRNAILT